MYQSNPPKRRPSVKRARAMVPVESTLRKNRLASRRSAAKRELLERIIANVNAFTDGRKTEEQFYDDADTLWSEAERRFPGEMGSVTPFLLARRKARTGNPRLSELDRSKWSSIAEVEEASEAQKWIKAGFDPAEAFPWRVAQLSAAQAKKWRDAGYTPNEATSGYDMRKTPATYPYPPDAHSRRRYAEEVAYLRERMNKIAFRDPNPRRKRAKNPSTGRRKANPEELTDHDVKVVTRTAEKLYRRWDRKGFEGETPTEIIVLSSGYAEVWADGEVIQHGRVIYKVDVE